MVNINKLATEGDVAELIRQFSLMFPGFAAAAAAAATTPAAAIPAATTPAAAVPAATTPAAAVPAATTPAAAVPAATTPAAAVPAATTPAAAVPTVAPVAPPATTPMMLPSSEETEGGIDIGAVFRCPSCDAVHYFTPSGATPSDSSANQSAPSNAGTPQVVRTGHFSAATGDAGSRWYGVVVGRQVGVFQNWQDLVEDLVTGVPGCKYKGFPSFAAAERFFLDHISMARVHPHPR
ncbi:hypothetical protein CCMSSC00406_0008320 [Pleurotus cornucopiae]|uniref:Uncharacterized protein n=1 Tax=Pleurotus cornucopiae TaxID=5321 RepID=A0ACB7IV57_PLECO|nr:hypothetical protein CCMSSC00406_0008320 [Pleurotus cornucopiae]